jgi:hypothetical protein
MNLCAKKTQVRSIGKRKRGYFSERGCEKIKDTIRREEQEEEEEEECKNMRTMRVQWCGIIIPAVN